MEDSAPTPEERREAAERIDDARAATRRLIASLTALWDDLVASSDMSNADDEHDPEGATIGFERASLTDSLTRAHRDLAALDEAAARLAADTYWTCTRCGAPIAPARLAARPTARTCITCAR